jgi:hypothetical protein
MNLDKKPYWLNEEGIGIIEEKYNAKFMGSWAIKRSDGIWTEEPVDVFYVENPDTSKGHTNYFGIFVKQGEAYITEASTAFSEPIIGRVTRNGEVLVSRFRHDFQSKDGVMIDGGRDYVRSSLDGQAVEIKVDHGEFLFKLVENTGE